MTDPMQDVIAQGLATKIGNGLFILEGPLAAILAHIDTDLLALARQAEAPPVHTPSMLSWENAQKSGYLTSFANQALIIDPYEGHAQDAHEGLACAAVCHPYFSSRAGKTIDKDFSITVYAKVFRREKGELENLGRLTNFSVRDVVFFGTESYCRDKRQEILGATKRLMGDRYQLEFYVELASDPFFGAQSELKKKAQIIFEAKYEMQAHLPFDRSRISIASFNHHGKVFYDRFGIKGVGEHQYSGCVGWGYERVLYAILAQKGTDFSSPYYRDTFRL